MVERGSSGHRDAACFATINQQLCPGGSAGARMTKTLYFRHRVTELCLCHGRLARVFHEYSSHA